MALKHVHFVTSGSFLEIVKRLQVKLGLTSRTALIMYCVTRIADQEGSYKGRRSDAEGESWAGKCAQ